MTGARDSGCGAAVSDSGGAEWVSLGFFLKKLNIRDRLGSKVVDACSIAADKKIQSATFYQSDDCRISDRNIDGCTVVARPAGR